MNAKKLLSLVFSAAFAVAALAGCGGSDFSREAARAANKAQDTVTFETDANLTKALQKALEDNAGDIRQAVADALGDELGSGDAVDLYTVSAEDAKTAAEAVAASIAKSVAGKQSEGAITMVKADDGAFYAITITTRTGSSGGSGSGSGSGSGTTPGGDGGNTGTNPGGGTGTTPGGDDDDDDDDSNTGTTPGGEGTGPTDPDDGKDPSEGGGEITGPGDGDDEENKPEDVPNIGAGPDGGKPSEELENVLSDVYDEFEEAVQESEFQIGESEEIQKTLTDVLGKNLNTVGKFEEAIRKSLVGSGTLAGASKYKDYFKSDSEYKYLIISQNQTLSAGTDKTDIYNTVFGQIPDEIEWLANQKDGEGKYKIYLSVGEYQNGAIFVLLVERI